VIVYLAQRPGLMVGTTELVGIFAAEPDALLACDELAGRPLDWATTPLGWAALAGTNRAAGLYTVTLAPVIDSDRPARAQ